MSDEVFREPGVERCEHVDVCEHDCRMGCRAYKPMVDREALLRIAQVLASADKSECEGCILEDSGCHICVVGVEHEIASRIRQAIGR